MAQRLIKTFEIRLRQCLAVQLDHSEDVIFEIRLHKTAIIQRKFHNSICFYFLKRIIWEVLLPHPLHTYTDI